jgi:hypothetical protein
MYKPMHSFRLVKFLSALLMLSIALSGCLGGTVAQQIARSIATSVADSAIGNAVEAEEKKAAAKQPSLNAMLYNPTPDPYRNAMLNMEFTPIKAISEPLPDYPAEPEETPIVILKTNPLVQVELFNLLIGEEKIAVLEKARLQGSLNIPDKSEWADWQVATGKIQTPNQDAKDMIMFLLPPEFGKLPSGSIATVELASSGEMSIARYKSY